MLRHVAVFRWIEGTSAESVDALTSALAALPAAIQEIRAYEFGSDAGLGISANSDFAVVADFDDPGAFAVYAAHPAHQDVIVQLLRPLVAERMSVQFPLGHSTPGQVTIGPEPDGG